MFSLFGCKYINNLHEIDPGKYYRSGQLTGKEFEELIKKRGIKTIINLRGPSTDYWYQDELATANRFGVTHIDIAMSAKRLPHRKDLIKLLESFETAERPILVHCQGGADRTGEATAIYQMLYMGKTKSEALKMLTVKYFHIEQKMPAKRYFISEIWKGADWTYNEYDPCSGGFKYYDPNSAECQGKEETEVNPSEDT